MDNVNQVGKRLKKTDQTAGLNERRIAENFPQIERVNDRMNPNQPYNHYFQLSDHPHKVSINLYFNEPEKPCHPEPLDVVAIAVGDCPAFPASSGHGATGPAIYPNGGYFNQIGGFVNQNQAVYPDNDYSSPGISVPVSGYYEISFVNGLAGVSTGGSSGATAYIVVNGGIIIQQFYLNANPTGLAFFSPPINLTTVAYLSAGDIVYGMLTGTGIEFWTPSDICGLFGGSPTTITLVGAA